MKKREVSSHYDAKMYKIMAEHLGEEIFVTDGDGRVMFVNPTSVELLGMPVDEIIGRTAQELENLGCFSHSVSMEVLRTGKKADILQVLSDGRTVLATGVPVYDKSHENILMVISTSKDVDAVNELLDTVQTQEEEISNLRENVFESEGFISADEKMKEIKATIAKIAPLDMPVLIYGETGVGKEVAVKALHRFSDRKDGPLFKINCGTIPENLIESELFGYERGAFTGAEKTGKKGKIEMASGGTLFLDEIGELPLAMQVKLLDFLQEGIIIRVGGTKEIKVDARVLAATNRNLKEMCKEGTFRQDLYFRLNVIPLNIPPLRERLDDIEALAKHFLKIYNNKYKMKKSASKDFYTALKSYDWPGNVRELENIMARVYVMSSGELTRDEFVKLISEENKNDYSTQIICMDIIPLKEAKKEVERQLVRSAYDRCGSTYKAADMLQVDQSTVAKIMKKLNENSHHS